jgi:hypothetical protein
MQGKGQLSTRGGRQSTGGKGMTQRVLGPSGSPRRRRWLLVPFALAIMATAIFAFGASGASLPGSNFEIDDPAGATTGANLVTNGVSPAIDWDAIPNTGSPNEVRATDTPTGTNDNSYKGGGSKEDDVCPGASEGGVPNNKSDLQTFGSYKEPVAGGPGVLHVFWQRVNSPQGTTNMDFEFNKSVTPCGGDSPNVQRTQGDILLQFDVDQGGKIATLSKRTWNGNATAGSWSDAVPLTSTVAIGAINQVTIPAAQTDGISTTDLTARTFGEASFDLASVFDPLKCESFGSAMLKSRSSSEFNSALKDFIAPIPLNIQNCGTVIIRKVTQPAGDSQSFGYTKSFTTDPASANTFSLTGEAANDDKTFNNVIFGTGLTVIEDAPPAGWAFVSLDCSASNAGVPAADRVVDPATRKVTFTINSASDVLDCTYTNRKLLGAIEVTKTAKHAASGSSTPVAQAGVSFTVNGVTKATGTDGKACFDGLTFAAAGTSYDVVETLPPGYSADEADLTKEVVVNNAATCTETPYVGESVAFSNTPLTDLTITIDSKVDGGTASTVACTNGGPNGATGTTTGTNGDGTFSAPNLPLKVGANAIVCTIVIDP